MHDAPLDPSSLIGIAIANGFSLFVAVYVASNSSGGHVNPAVTFSMAVGGRISLPVSIFYWISQLLGSAFACLLLRITTVGQVYFNFHFFLPKTFFFFFSFISTLILLIKIIYKQLNFRNFNSIKRIPFIIKNESNS